MRRGLQGLAVAALAGWTLACVGAAGGERAMSGGACPAGEECVEGHEGLIFTGQVLFDDAKVRLGPVVDGGTFELSFVSVPGSELGAFEVVTEPGLRVERLDGGRLTVSGDRSGPAYLRVVEPGTGRLYDRLLLDVVAIKDVRLDNVTEPGRRELYAGCEEMVGLELLGGDGEVRGFDQDVDVDAPGRIEPDPFVWDCFRYWVPADATEVTFTIRAGDQMFRETRPVDGPPGGVCPEAATSD